MLADDVSSPTKTNAIVIIGVLFSVAALLFFSILVVYFALIAQHRRYTNINHFLNTLILNFYT